MTTSANGIVPKPTGDDKISSGTLSYFRARARQEAYNLLIGEFKKSGLTQAQLARRSGKAPEIISRLFSRPRNVEIDTLSDVLFAICGGMVKMATAYPTQSAHIQDTADTASEDNTHSAMQSEALPPSADG